MKKIVLSILSIALILNTFTPSNAYALEKNNNNVRVLRKENYQHKQLDNNTLYKMAEDGILVNNENTQVDVSYPDNGETKVVRINKIFDKEVFSNGTINENGSVTEYIVKALGTKTETATDSSITIKAVVGFNYDKLSFDNGTSYSYKITNMFTTPTVLDSTFVMTNLYQKATQNGTGYYGDGKPALTSNTVYYTKDNPSSGTKYSADTGLNWYVNINDGSGGGTTSTITFKRINNSTTYTFSHSVYIGG